MNAGQIQTKHWSCTHCGGTEKYIHVILWCVSINSVQRLLASSCLAVCTHLTARLPLVSFSQHLVLGHFTNICREIPNLDIIIMGTLNDDFSTLKLLSTEWGNKIINYGQNFLVYSCMPQKAPIVFIVSAKPSLRVYQQCSDRWEFCEIRH